MKNVESSAPQFRELLEQARTVLLVIRANPSLDGIAAVLAMADTIKNFGKEVVLASPEKIESSLPGAEGFAEGLGPRELVISLDYVPGSIKKIHYGPEGNKFKFAITPAPGQKVSAENVEFAYTGAEYDLAVVFDTPELSVLGQLYEAEKDTWQGLPLINIDRNPANTQYGQLNVLDTDASSTSALTFRLIKAAGLPLSKLGAETLLLGLREASAGFSQPDPQIFETAAELSRVARGQERVETSEEKLVNEPFRKKEDYLELGAKLLG